MSSNEEVSFSTDSIKSSVYVETVSSICVHSISCGLSHPDRSDVEGPPRMCVMCVAAVQEI